MEQANVYGDALKKQPSEKDLINDAKAKIASLFNNVKTVDFEWKTVDGERKLVEKASTTDLFVSAEVEEVIF